MWASRISDISILVFGLSLFVLIECFDHSTNKHKSDLSDDLHWINGRSRSIKSHSHGAQNSHANNSKADDQRDEVHFRSNKRQYEVVAYRNASVIQPAMILIGSDLEKYKVADKIEFKKVLVESERVKSERLKLNVSGLLGGHSFLKVGGEFCYGYTCHFRDSCGAAPLNMLSVSHKSSFRTRMGARKKQIDSYMINGSRQKYGEWPSYVRLEIIWSFGLGSVCGGTLISDRHILTAAHCMYDPVKGKKMTRAENIRVIIGEDRPNRYDEHEKTLGVRDYCVSKRFMELNRRSAESKSVDEPQEKKNGVGGEAEKAKTEDTKTKQENTDEVDSAKEKAMAEEGIAKYDFAVLTLREKVQFSDYYQPSCMPEGVFTLNGTEYTEDPTCYLVGSGTVKVNSDGSQKMATAVEKMRMRRASCRAYGFGDRDESRECYTKAESVGDSCAGDSGGPILCLDEKTKRWSVVSLVSYGSANCDGKGAIGWVGVYTRVSNLLPIIKNECGI